MSSSIKSFLKKNYDKSSSDMYSAFIERVNSFCLDKGISGMITQDTFMFIGSYAKLREKLIRGSFPTLLHLGTHAFQEIGGEKVRSVAFTYRNNIQKTSFYRLIDSKNKKIDYLEGNFKVYKKDLREFRGIEDNVFAYWLPSKYIKLFDEGNPLGQGEKPVAEVKSGMQTGNNSKFLRYWWEVESDKWKPYAKGKGRQKFYVSQKNVVDWENEGKKLKEYEGSVLRNSEYYFHEGITYNSTGGDDFSARYLPEGHIFDNTSQMIFAQKTSNEYLLGLLTSSFANYILSSLNPTLSFQVSDIKKVPFIEPSKDQQKRVESKIEKIISINKDRESFDEISPHFKGFESKKRSFNGFLENIKHNILKKRNKIKSEWKSVDKQVLKIYGLNKSNLPLREYVVSNKISIDKEKLTKRIISYFIQISLGRWEMDGVESDEDGILMVSEGVSEDNPSLIDKIRECISAEWGGAR
ncbi:hypothetical protein AKJ40_04570 [candidate division MSBL1 archaeon SCGC-AAA259M10]|uniref:site-specific DNA-methyltransferase (adenine-specific) n=1 Tax=candidate division MSBL1 archaeon SCGC-AAA259M10 TaxID=1698270 RepID=A0A133UWT4_9EURY|nr:hypothetical protein AKJ40_04570 [candidate division MSBL1 archaeon SCGC-AAA259M10]